MGGWEITEKVKQAQQTQILLPRDYRIMKQSRPKMKMIWTPDFLESLGSNPRI